MELDELAKRIQHRKRLEELEKKKVTSYDPTSGMESIEELRNYCRFLYEELQNQKKQNESGKPSDEILEQLRIANRRADGFEKQLSIANQRADRFEKQFNQALKSIETLTAQNSNLTKINEQLTRSLETLTGQLGMANKKIFGSNSRSSKYRRNGEPGANDDRENFDGTEKSLNVSNRKKKDEPINTAASDKSQNNREIKSSEQSSTDNNNIKAASDDKQESSCYHGPSRKGSTYNKPEAKEIIPHECDLTGLPKGTKVLKELPPRIIRDVICKIVNNAFRRFKVQYPDGRIRVICRPYKEDEAGCAVMDEVVPGTNITANMLSFLLYNRYQMSSTAYREAKNRLADMDFETCRQNLLNWENKGVIMLSKLVPSLKKLALEDGANVNVDETWCRYQTHFGHRKTYMWCLVNTKRKIVLFFYEDTEDENGVRHEGGRRRAVLKEFLGQAKIKSLQSDGYNVYMYLDNELSDIEHICCMAHVHNKFQDALDCGCDKAEYFLDAIRKLYAREEQYKKNPRLYNTPEKIRKARNDKYTTDIIRGMKERMKELLAKGEYYVPDKMWKALNYLNSFWKQVMAYRNDGEYNIDNLPAERKIRNLAVQRKNSLFRCSTQGWQNSAIINTFIGTFRKFRDFFRQFIRNCNRGRTDYDAMLAESLKLYT